MNLGQTEERFLRDLDNLAGSVAPPERKQSKLTFMDDLSAEENNWTNIVQWESQKDSVDGPAFYRAK